MRIESLNLDDVDVGLVEEDNNPWSKNDQGLLDSPEAPFFLLENLVFEEELSYFVTATGVPLYYKIGEKYRPLGYVQPSVSMITKMLFLELKVFLVKSDGTVVDFSYPEDYFDLIVL